MRRKWIKHTDKLATPTGDPLDDFHDKTKRMGFILRNTDPKDLDQFKRRFAKELWMLQELLITIGEMKPEDAEDYTPYFKKITT